MKLPSLRKNNANNKKLQNPVQVSTLVIVGPVEYLSASSRKSINDRMIMIALAIEEKEVPKYVRQYLIKGILLGTCVKETIHLRHFDYCINQ